MDRTKNGEVTKVVLLEIKINGHKKQLEVAITDLNRTDIFLGHDWLVKHNLEVNWKNRIIKFMRCPGSYTMKYKDIRFKTRRTKATEIIEQNNREISKEPDNMNPEDLSNYIQSFTYLFNKKKFKKLPERYEWDYKINLTDKTPRELNAKAYTMTLKEEEALNQWLDEQFKAGCHMQVYLSRNHISMVISSLNYTSPPSCNMPHGGSVFIWVFCLP